MGFFSTVKDNWKKSEAAVVVQNLLEHQAKYGTFSADPAMSANAMVAAVWDAKPDLLNGTRSHRPHKMTVAGLALARFVRQISPSHDDYDGALLALGSLIQEVEMGRHPLTGLDLKMLTVAIEVFKAAAAKQLGPLE